MHSVTYPYHWCSWKSRARKKNIRRNSRLGL